MPPGVLIREELSVGELRDSQCLWKHRVDHSDPITILYGKAARSLGEQLKYPEQIRKEHPDWPDWKVNQASKKKAQELIDLVFLGMPAVKDMITGVQYFVSENQYAETILGRRRVFPQTVPWEEYMEHQAQAGDGRLCWCDVCKASRKAHRDGVNETIQGTVADLMMLVMVKCMRSKRLRQLHTRMVLQVHDELIFESPIKQADRAAPIIKQIMENPGISFRVPFRATPKIGDSWFAVK